MTVYRPLAFALGLCALAGCKEPEVVDLSYGFGTSTQAPAYILEIRIDGIEDQRTPRTASGGVDSYPRTDQSFTVSKPVLDPFSVSITWVEIITGRAYQAEATVAIDALETFEIGDGLRAELDLLLLPGGEMIVASDPLPQDGRTVTRDLQRVCGTRQPQFDGPLTDAKALSEIPRLADILGFATDPIDAAPCGGEQE